MTATSTRVRAASRPRHIPTSDDIQRLVGAGRSMLDATASESRRRLAKALRSGRSLLGRAENKAKSGAKLTNKIIHEHPYEAIAIAVGVGALISQLAVHRYRRAR